MQRGNPKCTVRGDLWFCAFEKLTASRCVGLFLACVVRRRVCHSMPVPVLVRWCKMVHNAAFDIASLVLDGGAVVKISDGAVVIVFKSV